MKIIHDGNLPPSDMLCQLQGLMSYQAYLLSEIVG